MSRFWSQVVRDLTPYVPGEQPKINNLIKLNTNENPFPPSPKVLAAIQAELGDDAARLRLYPDPNADLLKSAIARLHSVTPQQVFVGNGSDEVLAHVFMALLKHEAPILFPDITYSFYPVYCGLYGVDYIQVPLAEDFTINPDDYCPPRGLPSGRGRMWNGEQCGGIIFPNPNARRAACCRWPPSRKYSRPPRMPSSSSMKPMSISVVKPPFHWSTATTTCWSSIPCRNPARWPACALALPSAIQP